LSCPTPTSRRCGAWHEYTVRAGHDRNPPCILAVTQLRPGLDCSWHIESHTALVNGPSKLSVAVLMRFERRILPSCGRMRARSMD
jgi:hypothetical protein